MSDAKLLPEVATDLRSSLFSIEHHVFIRAEWFILETRTIYPLASYCFKRNQKLNSVWELEHTKGMLIREIPLPEQSNFTNGCETIREKNLSKISASLLDCFLHKENGMLQLAWNYPLNRSSLNGGEKVTADPQNYKIINLVVKLIKFNTCNFNVNLRSWSFLFNKDDATQPFAQILNIMFYPKTNWFQGVKRSYFGAVV